VFPAVLEQAIQIHTHDRTEVKHLKPSKLCMHGLTVIALDVSSATNVMPLEGYGYERLLGRTILIDRLVSGAISFACWHLSSPLLTILAPPSALQVKLSFSTIVAYIH
jgi:hypothetical protein